MKKNIILLIIIAACFAQSGCKKALDVIPPGEFSPEALKTEAGIKSVLFSAYASQQNPTPSRWPINVSENCTDIAFNSGGAENLTVVQIIGFTWDASLGTFQADVWAPSYRCIRDANIVIANVDKASTTDANKKLFKAEARFLRAYSYELLYKWFGPVPLRTSSLTDSTVADPSLARATEAEMKNFIESELLAAVPDLPAPGTEAAFARATKGTALGVLAKYYLNTKQWQKAADASQQIIALNYYQLYPLYQNMFRVENEGNKEMLLVSPCRNEEGYGNWYTAGALPPAFKTSAQVPEYVFQTGMANFAVQYRFRTAFTNTFDTTNDKRAILLIRRYVNTSGATVNLLSTPDNVRSLKYWDNATSGNHSGNDVPLIRYADILLTRAEALNELNGPTQEALDLINLVRTRGGIPNLTLAVATSQAVLRSFILRERAWEFYSEGKRREDLLRNGTFITGAQARGITVAAEKHKLFPIPQAEIDANPLCTQNPGY
jgi:starch-binding outer membrane protein, SusD/RagB family